ncbi:hypothetical protein V1505DRAFT_357046 [Lipomyces doorenjongii]
MAAQIEDKFPNTGAFMFTIKEIAIEEGYQFNVPFLIELVPGLQRFISREEASQASRLCAQKITRIHGATAVHPVQKNKHADKNWAATTYSAAVESKINYRPVHLKADVHSDQQGTD